MYWQVVTDQARPSQIWHAGCVSGCRSSETSKEEQLQHQPRTLLQPRRRVARSVMRQPLTGHPRGFKRRGWTDFQAALGRQQIGSLRTFVVVLDAKDKAPARPGDASQQGLARSGGEQGTDHIPEGGIARRKSLKPALVDAGGTRNTGAPNFLPLFRRIPTRPKYLPECFSRAG
jgi:hypothetical protein